MGEFPKVKVVTKEYIARGIEKYNGVLDNHLTSLSRNSGIEYTVYKFKDGRVLLVLPKETSAILYSNTEVFYEHVDLTK